MGKNGFYTKMAWTNILKNRQVYVPYILTCAFTSAMFYLIRFLVDNPALLTMRGGSDMKMILSLGVFIIGLMSLLFLLYSNGFLIKRRQKEFGLYRILGLEKRHIVRMLFMETVFTSALSLGGGILTGILLGKLMFLLVVKLLGNTAEFGFMISGSAVKDTILLFLGIFAVTFVKNCVQIYRVNPISFLNEAKAGEREPKAKWLMAALGLLCLGSGYYLAITTKSPLKALMAFFIAVLLVIAGTYLLFTAGSIAALKILRWNKGFYYKTRHFTAVSGMIYRMKQNASGLASICILSTGVLLMLSGTVSLYTGIEDALYGSYPYEISISARESGGGFSGKLKETIEKTVEEQQIPLEEQNYMTVGNFGGVVSEGKLVFTDTASLASTNMINLIYMQKEEYNRLTGEDARLSDGELLFCQTKGCGLDVSGGALEIFGTTYQIAEVLDGLDQEESLKALTADLPIDCCYLILNGGDFERLTRDIQKAMPSYGNPVSFTYNLDIQGGKEEELYYGSLLREAVSVYEVSGEDSMAYVKTDVREERRDSFQSLYAGLLFLGIFLGLLFLMGTTLIIYYKQISEGYEDKERYEIMQKVGMSKKEVRQSIRSQILMVFFLPLVMAAFHIAAAYPLMSELLAMFYMANPVRIVCCTAGTILAFAAVYGLIYSITARSYYRIVK